MNATKEMSADSEVPNEEPDEQSAGTGTALESSAPSAVLGQTRWVQYVFVVGAAFLLWFVDKVATLTWQNFAEPPTTLITAGSAVVAVAATVAIYRTPSAHTLVAQVVSELAKVTWPSRKETYASTIVVIITSLIAAAIIGAFDFVWSFFTDLLYKHKV